MTTETPQAVLAVYREMDASETDYQGGYGLVVSRDEDTEDYEVAFSSAANVGDLE